MPDRQPLEQVAMHGRRRTRLLRQLANVTPELDRAIREAHQAGHGYRPIAVAAGVSHQRVAQIIHETKEEQ